MPLPAAHRAGFRARLLAPIAAVTALLATAMAAPQDPPIHYYSTAAPPREYPGPGPVAPVASPSPSLPEAPPEDVIPLPKMKAETPREPAPRQIAANTADVPHPKVARPPVSAPHVAADPIAEAKAAIASCRVSYAKIQDYTCTFFKKERIDGVLSAQNVMQMKARTRPLSVYFKFASPTPGREAIYVAGSHGGKAVVHDVGIGKLLAGTLKLDPKGDMAMDGNRHPITDAGIGHMIDTISGAWDKELHAAESVVTIGKNFKVGNRPCVMIESVHPTKHAGFLYHKVRVFIDREHNLPIRFEAYDWPNRGKAPELVEEYIYTNLKLNVGMTGRDFDPSNASYSFGRF